MKNILLGVNAVLVIAVATLFFLHFKYHKQLDTISDKVIRQDTMAKRPLRIAYVDLDTIQERYEYYRERMSEFEKKKENADRDLNSAYQKIENERVTFVQRGNNITQVEAEAFQRDYTRKMQNLENQKRTMESQIQEDGIRTMDELRKRINDFLVEYNKERNYSYIFSYSSGLNVLFYKDTANNITHEVVAGLNETYKKTKDKK